ncbi:FAD/NAD(P)-binding protein [Streptomyces sp. BE20]|uniref:FAD/NAD(P)-binding protein n=1 Tax=Streptomyces sp. BE20 TaxID=3002525 RepID=UPI002E78A472|nr:FAD/NAD(P)-binding protein [Streptomyces sp. BE20]MEE1824679.1 FAD/NAD(P)-binding protein [Streptomyces sp. BE20]
MAPHSPGPSARHRQIAVVGAGPRGLSVLERLLANERSRPSAAALTVHLVDPYPPGAGRVWRTTQSRLLLMNTVASQVTVFTDPSVTIDGPVEEGPSLYQWAKSTVPHGGPGEYDVPVRAEARDLSPDAYPTRAFYGRYLVDVYRRVRSTAPAHCRVVEHRTRAVELDDTDPLPGASQVLTLADGRRLVGLDAVVLALGHVPAGATSGERALARAAAAHGLTYLPPANPADVDLSTLPPGRPVLVRGLGLNFFDHLALLTRGRGGRFAEHGGRLVYHPSGREPLIVAGSRRGVPYHARGENEKGAHGRHTPRLLTEEYVARLRKRAEAGEPVRFADDLWPLVAREVEAVYYATLLAATGHPETGARLAEEYLGTDPDRRAALLDRHRIPETERWDWHALAHPHADRRFGDRAEHRGWLLGQLARDAREARSGNLSGPLKAALDVLRDLRNEIRLAVDHGGIEGSSYRDDLESWYTPLNAFLSIGPPASRIDELRALIEAGVVEVLGPDVRIGLDTTGPQPSFTAHSPAVDAPPVRARALIEARLPEPDLRRTGDRLLRRLLDAGQARTYRIRDTSGAAYETGGLAVTERPYRLLAADGRAHPRRFAYGVPTEAVHWVTAAGIRPGVNSVTLGDSDAIARAVLALHPLLPAAAPAPVPAPVSQATAPAPHTGVAV